MNREDTLINLAKNNFIQYCMKRYKDDELMKDFYEDIQYLEQKNQAIIDIKKLKKDKINKS